MEITCDFVMPSLILLKLYTFFFVFLALALFSLEAFLATVFLVSLLLLEDFFLMLLVFFEAAFFELLLLLLDLFECLLLEFLSALSIVDVLVFFECAIVSLLLAVFLTGLAINPTTTNRKDAARAIKPYLKDCFELAPLISLKIPRHIKYININNEMKNIISAKVSIIPPN